jgi:septin 4
LYLIQEEFSHCGNPCHITPEEYFTPDLDLGPRDIGRPKEITTKIQKFKVSININLFYLFLSPTFILHYKLYFFLKATLWLCEEFPLSLPQQIMPIVDLMAISSSHFAKLKNFIQMQLPSGFPIKIGKFSFSFFRLYG